MTDITLSTGIRNNLLSLQNSSELLDRTQTRLSTGKKVNSALDDPLNFFQSSYLSARAGDLQRLLDGIGLGVRTIEAADKGIVAIKSIIDSTKAGALSTLQVPSTNAKIASGSKADGTLLDWRIPAGGTAWPNLSSAAVPAGPFTTGDTVAITYTVPAATTPAAAPINFAVAAGSTINDLVNAVNNSPGGLAGHVKAQVDPGGRLTIENVTAQTIRVQTGGAPATGVLASLFGRFEPPLSTSTATDTSVIPSVNNANRTRFAQQYNELIEQITNLAKDSSFNGTNLLYGQSLDLTFNETSTTHLVVQAVVYDAGGLGLARADTTWNFQSDAEVKAAITKLDTAITSLQVHATRLGSNLNLAKTREKFTKEIIKTLEIGADNLVIADINEEGANLLALQTRQQLSTQALSLASQSDQAVLRLFR